MQFWVAVAISYCLWTPLAFGADIAGAIIIKRKLTKRSVTVSASSYHRGVGVALPADQQSDPLSFERSRVVVYLEGPVSPKKKQAVMEQQGRRFLPDTLVVPVGSTVSFPNLDPIFHNVFSLSKPKSFDLGNYPQHATRTVTFSKPGIVHVHCHLHPNMAATIMITPNQWATRSSPEGEFVLEDVPPGTHTVVAWHKSAGYFRQTVNVTESTGTRIQFHIPLEEEAVAQAK